MDSIKIIKKHGQPGGLPVVTAYVDEDAPGEANPSFYRHIVRLVSATLEIITADATPFTGTTFPKWLKDNGFVSLETCYPYARSTFGKPSGNVQFSTVIGFSSSNGTTIVSYRQSNNLSIVDGALDVSSTNNSQANTSFTSDTVTEI